MKKVIAILMVLTVMGMAFAVNTLTINTTVAGRDSIKIGNAELTTANWGAVGADSTALLAFTPAVNPEDAPAAQTAYVGLRTNRPSVSGYKINVWGQPIASTTVGITTTIGYTLATLGVGAGSVTVDEDGIAQVDAETLYTFADEGTGMRVLSKAFTVTLTSSDYINATEDSNYTTNVYFELKTN